MELRMPANTCGADPLRTRHVSSPTLQMRTRQHAAGLTPRAVLEQLAGIKMIDVHLPVNDGRCLVMPRYTEPAPEQQLLLTKLGLELPQQPPPKIYPDAKAAQAPHQEGPNH